MLFDLDGETERSAFVISNQRWTVVVFSKYEEEHRLLYELRTWASRLIYIWVQDNDVWGYDAVGEDGFAASFSSDPKLYRSFPDSDFERPPADPEEVCRFLEVPEHMAELQALHRRRSMFAEDDCGELCTLLGVDAAALSYDDLERDQIEGLDDWQIEQMLFYHPDSIAPPPCGTDLHRIDLADLGASQSGMPSQSRITPDILAEVEKMRQRAQLRVLLLRPVSWVARSWRWMLERLAPRPTPSQALPIPLLEELGEAGDEAGNTAELYNERHQSGVTPAPGLVPQPVSGKPALVWAFRAAGVPVTCTARRRWKIADVLRPPRGSEVLRDEKYRLLSGLDARHLLFKLPPRYMAGSTDPSFLGLHVIETHQALYVFLYRFKKDLRPEVEDAVRETAMSFRLVEQRPAFNEP